MAGRKKARTLDFPVPAPALLNSGAAGAFLRPGPSATLTGKCLCTAHDADGFYRILGILPCATSEEVATAHRARRLRLHLGSCKDDAKETLGNLSTLLDQARPAQPLFAHARTQSTYTGKHATVHQAHARTTAQHTHARRTAYPTHTHTHTQRVLKRGCTGDTSAASVKHRQVHNTARTLALSEPPALRRLCSLSRVHRTRTQCIYTGRHATLRKACTVRHAHRTRTQCIRTGRHATPQKARTVRAVSVRHRTAHNTACTRGHAHRMRAPKHLQGQARDTTTSMHSQCVRLR
jgi:hypothetical protein